MLAGIVVSAFELSARTLKGRSNTHSGIIAILDAERTSFCSDTQEEIESGIAQSFGFDVK